MNGATLKKISGRKSRKSRRKKSMIKSKVAVSELQCEAAKVSEILEAKTAELEIIERQQRPGR